MATPADLTALLALAGQHATSGNPHAPTLVLERVGLSPDVAAACLAAADAHSAIPVQQVPAFGANRGDRIAPIREHAHRTGDLTILAITPAVTVGSLQFKLANGDTFTVRSSHLVPLYV